MKNKRKTSDILSFVKTPVGSCLVNIMTLAVLCIAGMGCLLVLQVVVWMPLQDHLFVQRNTPLVEEAIIEQCARHTYIAEGYFDTSSLDHYYDVYTSTDLRIVCQQDNYPHGAWNCTCEEQTSD